MAKQEQQQDKKTKAAQLAAARQQKRRKIKYAIMGVVALISFVVWFGLQPLKAGVTFGVCRTYVEANIKYPTTFRITQYDEFGDSMRLFYTYVDPYGGTRSKMIECVGYSDPAKGFVMDEIKIDGKPIDDEELRIFNLTIPGILAANPDLIVPRPPEKGNLNALRSDE